MNRLLAEMISKPSGLPDVADFLTPGDTAALDSRIEITLSNGHRLSVSGAFDPDAVSRLVRALTS
jgi:transposase